VNIFGKEKDLYLDASGRMGKLQLLTAIAPDRSRDFSSSNLIFF
jgi:hypothetical protein